MIKTQKLIIFRSIGTENYFESFIAIVIIPYYLLYNSIISFKV
jgi:hypothetical protein